MLVSPRKRLILRRPLLPPLRPQWKFLRALLEYPGLPWLEREAPVMTLEIQMTARMEAMAEYLVITDLIVGEAAMIRQAAVIPSKAWLRLPGAPIYPRSGVLREECLDLALPFPMPG